jgi:mRNA-degrading endonuclease RelE of RelBE toxin-antitoxin system
MPLLYDPKAFDNVPKKDIRMLVKKIEWLWEHRHEIRHLSLKENLAGYYKRRIDPYRIIYTYENEGDVFIVHLVGTRDEIYLNAQRRLN